MGEHPISIRPITRDDTPLIVQFRNNPAVRSNFIYQADLTEEDHLNWLKTRVETKSAAQFIIADPGGRDIGSVYLRDIDPVHRKAEFGIFIGVDEARGKGYGSQAARLILEYAFGTLGLNRVFLRALSGNDGAIRSYEKAGFRREGLFREDVILHGRPVDIIFMSVLASEWGDRRD